MVHPRQQMSGRNMDNYDYLSEKHRKFIRREIERSKITDDVIRRSIRTDRERLERIGLGIQALKSGKQKKALSIHEEKIVLVAMRGLKGAQYCRELDRAGVHIPVKWLDRGCPSTYAAAFKNKKWMTKINLEKSDTLHKAKKIAATNLL